MFDLISISDVMKLTYEQKGILIDVRSPEAYRNGHLPMAENVPLDDILDEKCRFDSKLPVFLYCDTGSSSMMAARKLDEDGIKAYSVAGGIHSYRGYLEKEKDELWTMVLAKE